MRNNLTFLQRYMTVHIHMQIIVENFEVWLQILNFKNCANINANIKNLKLWLHMPSLKHSPRGPSDLVKLSNLFPSFSERSKFAAQVPNQT